jgi:ubiquinone biosynthesis protein COQ4
MSMDLTRNEAASDEGEATSDNPIFYLNARRKIATSSSALISSSPWLNDPRIREWISTESLRRNGADHPLLYGLPTLIQAIDEVRDFDRVEDLIAQERRRNPALDRWFEERFVSTYTREDLARYEPGSIGRQLYDYMTDFDLSPQLDPRILANPDWKPTRDIEYFTLRSGQTHDFYHILGEVGFGTVAEYFITGVTTGDAFAHVSPELAGELQTINSLIMFPWMMRTMLHYPAAWPQLWANLTYGYEIGAQSDMLFTAKYEDLLHLSPAKAREALGWRAFRGPVDNKTASLIFGEGREIL